MAAAGGSSVGLVFGGLLAALGWCWVFIAPVVLATVLLCLAWPLIPRSPRSARAGRGLDLPGAVTATAGLVLFVLAVERATHTSGGATVGTFAAALGLAAVTAVQISVS